MNASDAFVRSLGPCGAVLHGDPCMFDRWIWLRHHLRPGPLRTLDAGSGSGAFSLYAARRGNDVVGVSFDTVNNDAARRRAALLGLENVEFVDRDLTVDTEGFGTFDQIVCFETIEHIEDDGGFVASLARLLRPGGHLFLTTPFAGYRPMLGDRLGGHGGHIRWGYTHDELRALLEPNGLQVIREDFVSGVISQQLTNVMRLVARIHPRLGWLATLPLRPLQSLDGWITRALRYPPLCVAVVAVKKS